MGIFGWSYPPGCSGPPEDVEGPCYICGKMADDCICEPCEEHGEQGCLSCVSTGNLLTKIEILQHQLYGLEGEVKKRRKADGVNCPDCGEIVEPDCEIGGAMYCNNCEKPIFTKIILKPKHLPIPEDFEVQPLKDGEEAEDRATCGTCGLSWDDAIPTSLTPAPSGRCPFEYFHIHDD